MKLLRHADLDPSGLERPFDQTVALLEAGNFRGAEVKKLTGTPLYRAKLSDADRLLFRFGVCRGETYLILLEIVRHHDYGASRFLRGAAVDESRLMPVHQPAPTSPDDGVPLVYVNPRSSRVHILDKILSFDDFQEAALQHAPPLILIGSAGSGKTVLTIEKLRQLPGDILYVTRSPYLVDNSRRLYYAEQYENERQDVAFLSFLEFVHSIGVPDGQPLTFAEFAVWFGRHRSASPIKDAHTLFEEFSGVLTGSVVDRPYLTLDDYLALGVRRSIFTGEERPAVHALFLKYLAFLKETGRYDLNLVCFAHHACCKPTYDFVVADEVQDLTAVQFSLILKSLRQPDQFVLCGDANQIVHPNFFSWAAIKSFFHTRHTESHREIARILNCNYRNSPQVTALANRLLLVKNARFGSIDRESHYLVNAVADHAGTVELLPDSDAVRRDIDAKTSRSARVALLVLRDEDKADARRLFRTPLVFSVQEAKGLEYETVVLLNFVSGQARLFADVADGVSAADLQGDFAYARARDKADKSLEAYKFFVNALYVALTRAVRNLYLIERVPEHPLLALLELRPRAADTGLAPQQSTDEEWQEEARRLERQGKAEQAEAIRRAILHTEPVPWTVVTSGTLDALAERALRAQPPDAKAQRLLLDYALTYSAAPLVGELAALGCKPALQPDIAQHETERRYTVDYHQRGYRELLRKVARHGVDFRDPLNRTPLMYAVQLGLVPLVRQLVAEGASLQARDNWGRIPLQIALRAAFGNRFYAKDALGPVYAEVAPPALDVRVAGCLLKIDCHRMEFFLLHAMLALFEFVLRTKIQVAIPAFETGDFIAALAHFPESVIPLRRRCRDAITAALASNEVFRDGPGRNRRLFVRLRRGFYIPNPCMQIALGDEWHDVRGLLNLDLLEREQENHRLMTFLKAVSACERDVAARFAAEARQVAAAAAAPAASGPLAAATPATPPAVPPAAPPAVATPAATTASDLPPPAPAAPPAGTDPSAGRPAEAGTTNESAAVCSTAFRRNQTVMEVPASPLAPPATQPAPVPGGGAPPDATSWHYDRYFRGDALAAVQALDRARGLPPTEIGRWLDERPEESATIMVGLLYIATRFSPSIRQSGGYATTHAALRAARARDVRALEPLVKLATHADGRALLGGCSAEDLGRLLASAAGEDAGSIEELARGNGGSDWAREGALHALAVLVLHGGIERERVIRFLARLLDGWTARVGPHVSTDVSRRVARVAWLLHPGELLSELHRADRLALLPFPPDPCSLPGLIRRAQPNFAEVHDMSRAETAGFVVDLAGEIRRWPCFDPAWQPTADVPAFTELHGKLRRVPSRARENMDIIKRFADTIRSQQAMPIPPMSPELDDDEFAPVYDGSTDVLAPPHESAAPAPFHVYPENPEPAVGRNAPCPCGSGRKYKKCCGRHT